MNARSAAGSEGRAAIMVAPNGARLTQQDHPAIPVTTAELVSTVAASVEAGAAAVHLHVRDRQQQHVLDAGLYLEAIEALAASQGSAFPVQITTEAVGRFSQAEQIDVVKKVRPAFASVALKEMAAEQSMLIEASRFYHWCQAEHIALQHIVYSAEELRRFIQLKHQDVIPAQNNSVLFVLGRYSRNQVSDTSMLDEFLITRDELDPQHQLQWMICAFGQHETQCLEYAASLGGHARVGFENNTLNEDGALAQSNAERVAAVARKINLLPDVVTGCDNINQLLGQSV